MIPLVDMHCHLLSGLDDGPRTSEEAVAMCRIAYDEGVRIAAATAHQNEHWPDITPERIRLASRALAQHLREANLPLTIFPCAEVMVQPELEAAWEKGQLLSVADRRQYLLLEMPHQLVVDLRSTVAWLRQDGIRPILAHPERHPEFLHEPGAVEELIEAGCLVQVSANSVTDPATPSDGRALKSWFRRGIVHCLGSDGHSVRRRAPRLAAAYRQIRRWVGAATADRICSTNGIAISQGLSVRIPQPQPRPFQWLSRLW
jgi:protein-tyrosine phosphatase